MLWVYINNQGVAECVVNVGNRIRQGDPVSLFICLEGMQEDAAIYQVNRVSYLKPGTKAFVTVGVGVPTLTSHRFVLGDPSMANSYFKANTNEPYWGYQVDIPSAATSFDANGGHVAFEVVLMDRHGSYLHAQTLSVFVEPTYGKKGTTITSEDYSTLVDYIRTATFNYSISLRVASENGVMPLIDDARHYPTLVIGNTMGFAEGIVEVDTSMVSDSASALPGHDDDGFVTIADTNLQVVYLSVDTQFVGRDGHGNAIRMRINGAGHGRITVEANIADLAISGERIVRLSFFGTCPCTANILEFDDLLPSGVVGIVGVTSTSDLVGPDYEGELVEIEVQRDAGDEKKGYLAFTFHVFKPAKIKSTVPTVVTTETRASGANASASVQNVFVGPDSDNEYEMGQTYHFGIPKGADGVITDAVGALGFQINADGQLIAHSSVDTPSGLSIDSNGQLIYSY